MLTLSLTGRISLQRHFSHFSLYHSNHYLLLSLTLTFLLLFLTYFLLTALGRATANRLRVRTSVPTSAPTLANICNNKVAPAP